MQLTLKPPDLTRAYWGRDGRITERRLPWHALAHPTGDDLFDTLFGSPETCEHVLKSLFGAAAEPARPIRHAVRVRIQTDVPILADLPWATMTWKSNVLRDSGWTFELMGGGPLTARPTFDDITFNTPCSVLMIAPDNAPHVALHHRAVEERLQHAWPQSHEPLQRVRTWAELELAWQQSPPRLVYYYGGAEADGNTLTLLFLKYFHFSLKVFFII